jgi:putative transposase
MSVADLSEEIKKNSSRRIKTKGSKYKGFYWQDGYGGFSLSYSGVDSIKMYIINQKKRHEKISFIDEYKVLPEEYWIPYDERYI